MKPRMKFPKLRLTVIRNDGYCYHNYKVGKRFIWKDFTHPPKYFCEGIAHSIFPAAYALTFGAKFPFEENMRSIQTCCPDGGKMEFLTEVLDERGRPVVLPKPKIPHKPNPKKLVITVEESKGTCFYGYKVGDTFEVRGLRTPPGFCGSAYHTLFPVLFALNFGAEYPFEQDPKTKTGITCPDDAKIKFKVTRIDE